MNKKVQKIIGVLVALLIVSIFCYGCVDQNGNEKEESKTNTGTFTIVDDAGRTVEIPEKVERVIGLQNGTIETVCALGDGDKIVGISSTVPPEWPQALSPSTWKQVEKVSQAGNINKVNPEQILELNPDVVFTTTIYPETIKTMEDRGITVVAVNVKSLEDCAHMTELIGKVMGREKEGNALAAKLYKKINKYEAKANELKAEEKPKVYFEGHMFGDRVSVGHDTIQNDLIHTGGGVNIYGGSAVRFPIVNSEYLVEKNPDIIIVSTLWLAKSKMDEKAYIKSIKERPGWNQINAVKNNKIYFSPFYKFAAWGNVAVDEGLDLWAEWIHPEGS